MERNKITATTANSHFFLEAYSRILWPEQYQLVNLLQKTMEKSMSKPYDSIRRQPVPVVVTEPFEVGSWRTRGGSLVELTRVDSKYAYLNLEVSKTGLGKKSCEDLGEFFTELAKQLA